jgi:hypothetical protein
VTTIICVEDEKARGSLAKAVVDRKITAIRQMRMLFMS